MLPDTSSSASRVVKNTKMIVSVSLHANELHIHETIARPNVPREVLELPLEIVVDGLGERVSRLTPARMAGLL